jgi:hypothetical protein
MQPKGMIANSAFLQLSKRNQFFRREAGKEHQGSIGRYNYTTPLGCLNFTFFKRNVHFLSAVSYELNSPPTHTLKGTKFW